LGSEGGFGFAKLDNWNGSYPPDVLLTLLCYVLLSLDDEDRLEEHVELWIQAVDWLTEPSESYSVEDLTDNADYATQTLLKSLLRYPGPIVSCFCALGCIEDLADFFTAFPFELWHRPIGHRLLEFSKQLEINGPFFRSAELMQLEESLSIIKSSFRLLDSFEFRMEVDPSGKQSKKVNCSPHIPVPISPTTTNPVLTYPFSTFPFQQLEQNRYALVKRRE
jgi:hypothetical protein